MRGTKPLLVFSAVVLWDACECYDPVVLWSSCSQILKDLCMRSTPDRALPVASAVRESYIWL